MRETAQTWLAVTGVLVAIVLSNQLSRVLGQATVNQYGRHVVAQLIVLGSVMNLSVILPIAWLLAVVLVLGRMYHDSEMAALQACGFGPTRLLRPLLAFGLLIALILGWLTFVQVPWADRQTQTLREQAYRNAQFGSLDAGRFRSFSGGNAVFYAERIDPSGLLHNVFVEREQSGRMELALAETATYARGDTDSIHIVTLYNGHRYEGVPGTANFRVIDFREHGIPVITPRAAATIVDPDTKTLGELLHSPAMEDIAQLEARASGPILALVLTLIAVPISRLRPRQGRYARVGYAILVYFVYANLLNATKVWVAKGVLSPLLGPWWVHALALALALGLLFKDSPPRAWRGAATGA